MAFADSDSAFMASPLVETFTRMAWMGQEYVMVSCSEGHGEPNNHAGRWVLSVLIENPPRGKAYILINAVQETCKAGRSDLSILNPSMLFIIMSDLGFCSRRCRPVEWMAWIWHLHTWNSQARYMAAPHCFWQIDNIF